MSALAGLPARAAARVKALDAGAPVLAAAATGPLRKADFQHPRAAALLSSFTIPDLLQAGSLQDGLSLREARLVFNDTNLSSVTSELKQSPTVRSAPSTSAGITTAHAAAAGHCCGRTGAAAKGTRGSYQPPGGLHAFNATAAERMSEAGSAPRAAPRAQRPCSRPGAPRTRRRPLNRPGPHGAPPSNSVSSKLCSTARNTCMRGCLPSEQPTVTPCSRKCTRCHAAPAASFRGEHA